MTAEVIPSLKTRSAYFPKLLESPRIRKSILLAFLAVNVVPPTVLVTLSEAMFANSPSSDNSASQALLTAGLTLFALGSATFATLNTFVTTHFVIAARRRLHEIASNSQELSANKEFSMLSLTLRKVIMAMVFGSIVSTFVIVFVLVLAYYPDFFVNEAVSKGFALANLVVADSVIFLQVAFFAIL